MGRYLLPVLIGAGVTKLIFTVLFLFGGEIRGDLAPATASTSDPRHTAVSMAGGTSVPASGCQPETLEALRVRIRELDEREARLEAMEKDLELLSGEIERRIQELKALQVRLEGPAKTAANASEARFEHLVGVYSAMDPSAAAALLDKMDESTVVRIFASMKSKKVAMILALMDPDRAARITDVLSRRRLPGDGNS